MEPEEELHSFPYDAIISGIKHHYRITENEHQFGIEQDGLVIATVKNKAGHWQQLSGDPLRRKLLESICDHIEAHYT
ncbi:hypothetical protein SNE25_08470 [Mucilaginibacter sabulilitoris]|uniref:Uncharacterized protein n=1 Tax=Mucilaginibacter sabulilitoris TaxID=1173583 RepID=A0ABZ0TVT1_9SPHI|nr:hypothetical protein [Mucilaginibacter sabulilitoris]WPU95555.1 hypothetical protein SNE25_08470 [Mucilaginibacter sabulilitoris]